MPRSQVQTELKEEKIKPKRRKSKGRLEALQSAAAWSSKAVVELVVRNRSELGACEPAVGARQGVTLVRANRQSVAKAGSFFIKIIRFDFRDLFRFTVRIPILITRRPGHRHNHHLSSARGAVMASSVVNAGSLVMLEELIPSSPFFHHGTSLRVTGKLEKYDVRGASAIIVDGSSTLTIDTEHLRINFRIGSVYQFIGELDILPDDDQAILRARVGRNVDGIDLSLHRQSIELLRKFQAEQSN